MRHRKKGRKLGRNPKHQRALMRSLACALILTEIDPDDPCFNQKDPTVPEPPKTPGRIITTLAKAKEVRPFIEKCVTIAKKVVVAEKEAAKLQTKHQKGSPQWQEWRKTDEGAAWVAAIAPAVAGRRRLVQILGDKKAVQILCYQVVFECEDRSGGYTRILRLAKPRLGDSAPRAVLEFSYRNERNVAADVAPAVDASEQAD